MISDSFRSPFALALLGDSAVGLIPAASQLEVILKEAKALRVDSPESAAQASDLVKIANHMLKDLQASKDEKKRPVLETGRMLDSIYKPAIEACDEIKSTLKTAQLKYMQKLQEQKRLEAQAKPEAIVPASKPVTRTDISQTTFRSIRRGRVVDLQSVPRHYLEEVVRREADKAEKNGARSIIEHLILEVDKMNVRIEGTEVYEGQGVTTR